MEEMVVTPVHLALTVSERCFDITKAGRQPLLPSSRRTSLPARTMSLTLSAEHSAFQ